MSRQASLIVSDDFFVSLTGKFIVHGVYTTDIIIPVDPTPVHQLVFVFHVETDIDEPFERLRLQVTLPGQDRPTAVEVPNLKVLPTPERTRWLTRFPLLMPQPVLRPGRIDARVIHEKGEIIATAPWISLAQAQAPAARSS